MRTRSTTRALALLAALSSLVAAPSLLGGCSKKDDAPAPTPGSESQKKPTEAAKPLVAPPDVMAYGGSGPVTAAVGSLHGMVSQAMPIPAEKEIVDQIRMALQGNFRLTDAAAIVTDRPLRFAILDPAVYTPLPTVILLPITSPDALAKALPETERKENDAGNAWSFKRSPSASWSWYVNFVDGHAVFAAHPEAFSKNADFLRALAAAPLSDLGEAHFSTANALARHKTVFDEGLKEFRETASMAAQMGGGESSVKTIEAMARWIEQAAGELDRVSISGRADKDGLRIELAATPRAGTPLGKRIASLKGDGRHDLINKYPADSSAFLSFAVAPDAISEFSMAAMQISLIEPFFAGDAAAAKPYVDAMRSYAQSMDGRMAIVVHPDKVGLTASGLFGLRDGKAARAANEILSGLYEGEHATTYYEKVGVKMERKKAAYEVDGTSIDIVKTTLGTPLDGPAAAFGGLMNELMTQHIGLGDKLGVMAYGADAQPTVTAVLTGKLSGLNQSPGAQRVLKTAAENALAIIYINPIELAKRLQLGGMNPLAGALQGVESTTGIGISVGVRGETALLVLDLPTETVKSGMVAVEKGKGAF